MPLERVEALNITAVLIHIVLLFPEDITRPVALRVSLFSTFAASCSKGLCDDMQLIGTISNRID